MPAHSSMPAFQASVERVPEESLTYPGQGLGLYASGYRALSAMHLSMAEARIHVVDKRHQQALEAMRRAVDMEGRLGYMDPPRAYQPSRQCLGWVLLQSRDLEAAEKTYKEVMLIETYNATRSLLSGYMKETVHGQCKHIQTNAVVHTYFWRIVPRNRY